MFNGRNLWRLSLALWGIGGSLLLMRLPIDWPLASVWALFGAMMWWYRRAITKAISAAAQTLDIHGISDEPLEAIDALAAAAHLQMQKAQQSTAHLATHLQSDVYVDAQTHLGNRNFFDARIEVLLQPELNTGAGLVIFLLLQMDNWPDEARNDVIEQAGVLILNVLRDRPDAIVARRHTNEFAVALHPVKDSDVSALCNRLCRALKNLILPANVDAHVDQLYFLGATVFSPDVSRYELYSTADLALRTAQLRGNSGWVRLDVDRHMSIRGMVAWRTLFDHVLTKRHFGLIRQPVLKMADHKVWAQELFAVLWTQEGVPVSASEFVPMALASGYLTDIDRMLIDDVVKMLMYDDRAPYRVIVNIHPGSLAKENFSSWLIERLAAHPALRDRLVVEISYASLPAYAEKLEPVISELRRYGTTVGFDHVGETLVDVTSLMEWTVDYIKVHQTAVREIRDKHYANQAVAWLSALAQLCRDRGIALHAEGIEQREQWLCLREVGFAAGQGFLLGKPTRLQRLAGERVLAEGDTSR